jgi:hypothetical protein
MVARVVLYATEPFLQKRDAARAGNVRQRTDLRGNAPNNVLNFASFDGCP